MKTTFKWKYALTSRPFALCTQPMNDTPVFLIKYPSFNLRNKNTLTFSGINYAFSCQHTTSRQKHSFSLSSFEISKKMLWKRLHQRFKVRNIRVWRRCDAVCPVKTPTIIKIQFWCQKNQNSVWKAGNFRLWRRVLFRFLWLYQQIVLNVPHELHFIFWRQRFPDKMSEFREIFPKALH